MAHESFEDADTAELINAGLRGDQGRPRGAAGRRRGLHAGHPGDDRPGRLADDASSSPPTGGRSTPAPTSRRVPRHGMPSFGQVLDGDRRGLAGPARRGASQRRPASSASSPSGTGRGAARRLTAARLRPGAVASCAGSSTTVHGGFGGAPKFPPSMVLEALLRHGGDDASMVMVDSTCEAMARGGIYDQLGGGFARYSVDAGWVVPHFEKMLYDNALLLGVYTHWWRLTGTRSASGWSPRRSTGCCARCAPTEGGFAASLDADTLDDHGRLAEGAFYVWNPEQLVGRSEPRTAPGRGDLRGHRGGHVRGRRSRPCSCSADPDPERLARRAARRCWRLANSGPTRPGRQGGGGLERLADRFAGAGGR